MPLIRRLFAYAALLLFYIAAVFVFVEGGDVELDCDPCINRPAYRIQAIVHGTYRDKFWQRVRASALQAALDMRVELDFVLYDEFDPEAMAKDIEAASTSPSHPDALIVSIPAPVVASAVEAAAKRIPTFGINSGYELANKLGVLEHIAMDEYRGGLVAAELFRKETNVTRALFINHEKGNNALDDRFFGFRDGLDMDIDELVVNLSLPETEIIESIESVMDGCGYDAVLLAGGSEVTMDIFLKGFETCTDIHLGAFDGGTTAYGAIATGRLSFAISQQSHLQGTLSVVAAALHATTEKKLSNSQATFGTYLSGPAPITLDNLPSDTVQTCEEDAFPVCPNTFALDGVTNSSCTCLDRSSIKIAGVLHGITTDAFWDVVFAQATQAADDLGVELKIDRLEPQPSADVLHSKMARQIISLCSEGVDGIFITIPSELLHDAVKKCHELNVPVISINAGASSARELNIVHHIAQLEYDAGYEAGQRMALEGIHSGICLNHDPINVATIQRCEGFKDGISAKNVTYLGSASVPLDSKLLYIQEVERIINTTGDWDGIGALSIGADQIRSLLATQEQHPKLQIGTFDINPDIYNGLNSGKVLFGIDQNAFMQGYMPVWLLTIMVHTRQNFQNQYIKTGPRFVERAPSNALQTCTVNNFKVCPPPVTIKLNQLTRIRPYGLALAGISMVLSLGLMIWVIYNRNTAVVRKSQPLFLGMICAGTFLMSTTIIPLSIDDSIASEEVCTIACMTAPWLFWIGFIFAFSALSSKIERIRKLVEGSSRFRRVTVTAWDVMIPFLFLLTLTTIFLLVWTIVDPMFWVRQSVFGSKDDRSTFGSCAVGKSNVSVAMLACLIVLAFACVIRASVSAWKARAVNVEYSESKYISVIVIGMLQTFPIGIPLVILSYANPTAKYFVKTAIIFALTLSISLLIFVPKIIWHRKGSLGAITGGSGPSQLSMDPSAIEIDNSGRSALRVVGLSRISRASRYARERRPIASRTQALNITEVVSGLTTKQVEDLEKVLQSNLNVDNIDLRQLVQSIGIVISDEEEDVQDVTDTSGSGPYRSSTISSNLASSNCTTMSDDEEAPED